MMESEVQLEIEMTPNDEVEGTSDLELEDQNFSTLFSTGVVSEPMPMVYSSQPTGQANSLPQALCDEELLKEIQAIPDKMGFKIGEVADLLGVKQYVLRYWESEFEVLRPKKASNNQRYFTRRDVENALIIRKLLHRDRFSVEGARAALKEVRQFVRKEKDWSGLQTRVETLQERVDDLILDLRRLREIFN